MMRKLLNLIIIIIKINSISRENSAVKNKKFQNKINNFDQKK